MRYRCTWRAGTGPGRSRRPRKLPFPVGLPLASSKDSWTLGLKLSLLGLTTGLCELGHGIGIFTTSSGEEGDLETEDPAALSFARPSFDAGEAS